MRDLASATPALTTATFTLIGVLGGAIIASIFPFLTELLRRKWQRKDSEREQINAHRKARLEELKTLYPKVLAKGAEMDFLTVSAVQIDDPELFNLESDLDGDERALKFMSQVWPQAGALVQELQILRAQVELIGSSEVRRLVREWYEFVIMSYLVRCLGKTHRTKDPIYDLMEAMRKDLEDSQSVVESR
jgi:hypothetical protein